MDKSDLLETISNTLVKAKVKELALLAADNKLSASDLLDLTFHPQREVAFRAAWVLEFVAMNYPESFVPLVKEFLDRYPDQANQSCQRHFTKIMMCLTDRKGSDKLQLPPHYNVDLALEKTFEWLIDPETPVAVRVNCMDVLFSLRDRLPWVAEELQCQIVFFLQTGSPALQSRGKAILRKLERQITS